MKNLTPKQLKFVASYCECGNKVEAYRRAYDCANMAPATISRKAQEVAALPHVAVRIALEQEDFLQRHKGLADEVIATLKGIAFSDITKRYRIQRYHKLCGFRR